MSMAHGAQAVVNLALISSIKPPIYPNSQNSPLLPPNKPRQTPSIPSPALGAKLRNMLAYLVWSI
jgi:hypothetical protein